jgi:hypothetical protein
VLLLTLFETGFSTSQNPSAWSSQASKVAERLQTTFGATCDVPTKTTTWSYERLVGSNGTPNKRFRRAAARPLTEKKRRSNKMMLYGLDRDVAWVDNFELDVKQAVKVKILAVTASSSDDSELTDRDSADSDDMEVGRGD